MKNTFLIIGLLFLISACNKNEPKFIDKPSDELVKYVVYLSGLKTTEYSKYINDEFVEVTNYFDYDSVIERITKNAADEETSKTVYYMGPNGVADSSVSYNYITQGYDIYQATYEYTDGFLIEINAVSMTDGNPVEVHILRTIEDENVVSLYVKEPSGCTDHYSYNNEINKIDLGFYNGIIGKASKNLKVHTFWNSGCPCGPSSAPATSVYKYETDNNGFVIREIETYTPCYHTTDPGTVTRTISTTTYEYHLNLKGD